MNLDGRERRDLERVPDRPRVVRPGSGVEHDRVRQPLDPVQMLDEVALVVGLEETRLESELVRVGGDPELELGQREAAVEGRVAAPELVEVDPMHDLDAVAVHATNSRTAAARSSAAIVQPGRGAPGAWSSTNGTGPSPTRFLSRHVACTIASGSASVSVTGSPRATRSSRTSWRRSS